MGNPRQVIRRVRPSGAANFDEQMWPINAMLVMLTACLAGVVVALSRFDDPGFFTNAWTQLSGIVIILTGLLVGTNKLQSRIKNRRMQLSIVVALFCYFWLILAMHELGFSLMVVSDDRTDAALGEQAIRIPEFIPEQSFSEAQQNPLMQPTESRNFDQSQLDVRPDARDPAAENRPRANEPTTTPDIPDPNLAMNRQYAAPRRSDAPGGSPSRSEREDRLAPSEPVRQTELPREDVVVERRLDSQPTQVERQDNTDSQMRERVDPQPRPNAVATSPNTNLQRREAPQPTPDVASDASPMSRSNTSAQLSAQPNPLNDRPLAEAPTNRSAELQPNVASSRNDLPARRQADESGQATTEAQITENQITRRDAQATNPSLDGPTPRLERTSPQSNLASAPAAQTSATPELARNENNAATNDAALQPAESGAARSENAVAASAARRGEDSSAAVSANNANDLSGGQVQRADGSSAQPSLAQASPGSAPRAAQSGGGLTAASANPAQLATTAGASNSSAGELRPAAGDVGRSGSGEQVAVNRPQGDAGNLNSQRQGALPSTQMTRAGSQTGTGNPAVGQGQSASLNRARVGQLAGGDQAAADPSGAPSVAESTGQTPGLTDSSATVARNDGAAGGASQRRATGGGQGETNNSVIGDAQLAANTAGGSTNSRPTLNRGNDGSGVPRRAGTADSLNPGTVNDAGATNHVASGQQPGQTPQLADSGGSARAAENDGTVGQRRGQADSNGLASGGADLSGGAPQGSSTNQGDHPVLAGGGQSGLRRANRDANNLGGQSSAALDNAGGSVAQNDGPNGNPGAAETGPTAGMSGERMDTELAGRRARLGGSQSGGGTGEVALGNENLSRAAGGADGAPELGDAAPGRATRRRNEIAGLSAGSAMADDPGPQPGGNSRARADVGDLGPSATEATRGETNSLLARTARKDGAGGTQTDVLGDPGQLSRHAREDSDVLDSTPRRFNLDKSSGSLALDLKAADVPEAFRDRDPGRRADLAEDRGGNSSSEAAVERGLAFLARHQEADGHWSLNNFSRGRGYGPEAGEGGMESDCAATGLALLAFLGAGYTHERDKYSDEVRAGLDFLISHQMENGDLFSNLGGAKYTWLYSHGIASIALCEAYGMTQDPQLQGPAQRALNFIAAAQEPSLGGWRYAPGVGTDTSVSGWQMMALKSGELAGLNVSRSCYAGVDKWLKSASAPANPATYIYRPGAEQIHQRTPSLAMTAEGMLMRLYVSRDKTDSDLLSGATKLRKNLPGTHGEAPANAYSESERDAYYWYYGTQILFQMQGPAWEDWNNQLRPLLVGSQEQEGPFAGSWDPNGAKKDRWGQDGGRIYLTCLNLLMLEVYYRNLPLYADQGR